MSSIRPLKILHQRRREILAKLEDCQNEMMRCHQELRRLDEEEAVLIAEENSVQLMNIASREAASAPIESHEPYWSRPPKELPLNLDRPNRGRGLPHPPGAPPILHMVMQMLLEAQSKEPPGLKGREIVEIINDRWWKGVSQNTILPALYKFEDDKYIRRHAGRWELVAPRPR